MIKNSKIGMVVLETKYKVLQNVDSVTPGHRLMKAAQGTALQDCLGLWMGLLLFVFFFSQGANC